MSVVLPENYWREHFKSDEVEIEKLESVSKLFVSKGEMNISFAPIAYMKNLKELVVHNCNISDFNSVSKAQELKKIVFINCTFDYSELLNLEKLEKLQELTLGRMSLDNLKFLSKLISLKSLSLLHLPNINCEQLSDLTNIEILDLTGMNFESLEFLKTYQKLKELKIQRMKVSNLEFLEYLKSLTSFSLREKAKDEKGLRFIKELKHLKEFEYPVTDVSVYLENEKLEKIGLASKKIKNAKKLKGTQISSVIVCNAENEKQAQKIIKEVEKYIDLRSSGFSMMMNK